MLFLVFASTISIKLPLILIFILLVNELLSNQGTHYALFIVDRGPFLQIERQMTIQECKRSSVIGNTHPLPNLDKGGYNNFVLCYKKKNVFFLYT